VDNLGYIEIKVVGKIGEIELTSANFDIKQLSLLLNNVEDLLFPNNKNDRPLISYDIQSGSVINHFKTGLQYVVGFGAILLQIQHTESIDFLETKTAKAFENIQQISKEKNYQFLFSTSEQKETLLKITPETKFYKSENMWADAEFYFYGTIKDAGGKSTVNIHLDTKDNGYLKIETKENFLKEQEKNLLYKKFGVRASGKQNVATGEIDTTSLKLIELIDYNPRYDAEYLNSLIAKAQNSWQGVEPDVWLADLRGSYE